MEALFKYLTKDMLRGLGIGFLISGMLVVTFPEGKNQVQLLTDNEVKAKAKQLGMIEKKDLPNKSKTDEIKEKSVTPVPKVTPPIVQKKKPIKVVIPKGSNLSDIADILFESGAIKDKKKFISLAEKLKLSTKFDSGNYVIPPNAETLDILTIMTK